jgi:predicted dehydrogenase
MSREVNVGLIGFGMAGRVFHAPTISAVPGLRLRKVVERQGDRSRDRYPKVEIVRTVEDLLRDGTVELVVVATPNSTHFALARQALEAGRHVVVDKPFTVTYAEAQELVSLARVRERLLTVFHNRRWDGDFLTVRRIVDAGVLGRLVDYEAHFDRFRSALKFSAWKEQDQPGAGILYDLGSHLIDQALVLFGWPETVTANLRVQRDGARVADAFDVALHYPGLKATLKAGMLVRERGPRFVLHGTSGSFLKSGMDPQEEALSRGSDPAGPEWGREEREQWGILNTDLGGLHVEGRVETLPGRYQAFYENVYAAILGHEELVVEPEAAGRTIRLIELAEKSHAERRTLDITRDPSTS